MEDIKKEITGKTVLTVNCFQDEFELLLNNKMTITLDSYCHAWRALLNNRIIFSTFDCFIPTFEHLASCLFNPSDIQNLFCIEDYADDYDTLYDDLFENAVKKIGLLQYKLEGSVINSIDINSENNLIFTFSSGLVLESFLFLDISDECKKRNQCCNTISFNTITDEGTKVKSDIKIIENEIQ